MKLSELIISRLIGLNPSCNHCNELVIENRILRSKLESVSCGVNKMIELEDDSFNKCEKYKFYKMVSRNIKSFLDNNRSEKE